MALVIPNPKTRFNQLKTEFFSQYRDYLLFVRPKLIQAGYDTSEIDERGDALNAWIGKVDATVTGVATTQLGATTFVVAGIAFIGLTAVLGFLLLRYKQWKSQLEEGIKLAEKLPPREREALLTRIFPEARGLLGALGVNIEPLIIMGMLILLVQLLKETRK